MVPLNDGNNVLLYGKIDCKLMDELSKKYKIHSSATVSNLANVLRNKEFKDSGDDFKTFCAVLYFLIS